MAESLGWAVRMVFAAVFATSAFGKLTARQAARDALLAFGIGARWVPAAAWVVPVAEAFVALGLLLPVTGLPAAATGILLLSIFTVAVAVQLLRGNHPSCACFGAADVAPIGPLTLVRNGVLLTLGCAVMATAVRYPSLPSPLPADRAALITVGVAVVTVQIWQGLALRRIRRAQSSTAPAVALPSQLPVGTIAPEFDLAAAPGIPATLSGLLADGRPQVLLFLHHGCSPCRQVAGELGVWRRKLHGQADITVIGSGTLQDNALWSEEYGIARYLVQQYKEVAERYAVRGTPTGVRIGSDGRIATGLAIGGAAIRALLSESQHDGSTGFDIENLMHHTGIQPPPAQQ
ncbi:MauE/DoxX family redox-associated membrane protein [Nocardia sp. NPDC006630]|uniref:MauE/DoxX family redox-associated membrane protein n=1 Tax=Nocardia sp. NPDC006630 TaxID=3157181 RepID=UPI0033A2FC29